MDDIKIKMVGKKLNLAPLRKKQMKNDMHHFLSTCIWDAFLAWSSDMEGHTQQVSDPCLYEHQVQRKELESV